LVERRLLLCDARGERLKPGSCVSFYFDGRLGPFVPDESLWSRLEEVLDRQGGLDVCCGFPSERDHEIAMQMLCRDDDGEVAITATVPDADGIARRYPH
jgi:hypothetical protein